MISFSADAAGMCTSPSACGPSAMPAIRKIATSGTLIFCATNAASVPIARISPQESSVCWAIAAEASMPASIQRLEPGCNVGHGDIGLLQELAHGEEAMELAGEMLVGDGNAGFLQPCGIFVTFVAQGIGTCGQDIGRR